jgi:hypothetical protein
MDKMAESIGGLESKLDKLTIDVENMSAEVEPVTDLMDHMKWGRRVVVGFLATIIAIGSTLAAIATIRNFFSK